MCAEKTSKGLQHVIVYSMEWAKTVALKYLCGHSADGKEIFIETTGDLRTLFSRLSEKSSDVPDIIVLDIPPRDFVGLLCHIRHLHPALPVVITQSRILFSDRAVASWFGNIWLREYDSLMAGYPDVLIDSCLTDLRFAGAYSSAACSTECPGRMSDAQLLNRVEQWLCGRLTERIGSGICAQVATEWLSRGISAHEVGKRLNRSDKLVYHYRSRIIQELRISGHPRDFIASLSLKEGPVPLDRPVTCQMRVVA
ncbi:hypothetical protein OGY83_07900 [Citrobacter sp. Cpo090]|uniref:hypothetical protein n=1 Tax=Citrobacter sp. Cpo090 TaxID=2985139 RepID=UPI00257504C2|nr:hypothetical protein [Citrobacter sp. Cpo090]MDM2843551.1 hypothetical protein [Citrobacter sp. Cpo090]